MCIRDSFRIEHKSFTVEENQPKKVAIRWSLVGKHSGNGIFGQASNSEIYIMGINHVGFGSDLCQDQPDSIVEWMRVGKWTKNIDYGEGSASNPGFPNMPTWFRDNRDWHNIIMGLKDVGYNEEEVDKIKGKNWLNFFRNSFRSIKK